MKVLAKKDEETFLVEITATEVNKILNLAYRDGYGTNRTLKVGSEINLGMGHDFYHAIAQVCDKMQSTRDAFTKAQRTMDDFARLIMEVETRHGADNPRMDG